MKIAEVCFNKRTIVYVVSAALAIAGWRSYYHLGRLEDPEYTIRAAQIITQYPGATAEEVAERVTDPIETAAQRLGKLKHVTSTSYPGKSIVVVELRDQFVAAELPQIWTELRHKIGDMKGLLPEGCSEPLVVDDYGDVYGVFYSISGDGYTYAELLRHAKLLRKELLLCKDVAKIDLIGDRQEAVWLDINRGKLAAMQLQPSEIYDALKGQSLPADAGVLNTDTKRIRLRPTGEITDVEQLGEIRVRENVCLKDVVTITRGYVEPAAAIVRRNGNPSIGLGISTARGGNVITMGKAVEDRMRELVNETPLGIEIDVISHQATSVETAVGGFVENLIESVLLVIAVLLFTMGMRSGVVIGGVLIMTVLATVFVMDIFGIMFERISLGAFIIALGMLVDNAIVICEAILVAAQKGESKRAAAIAVVEQTKWALLGGTSIAVLSFAPIGATSGSSGEYCRSLFTVILISLMLSWVFALTITPLLGEKFLKSKPSRPGAESADPYGGFFFRTYRVFLEFCVGHRLLSLVVLTGMLVLSVFGFTFVKQNFFPDSTRPQLMVHVWMPEGTRIEATDAALTRISEVTAKYEGVTGVSSFAGTGSLRFLLTYSPEEPNPAYGLILVDVDSDQRVNEVMARIEAEAPAIVPDAETSCQRFVLGPGDPSKIQVRLLGPDARTLRRYADSAMEVLRADGRLKQIDIDWRNRVEVLRPVVSEVRCNRAGLSRGDVSRALQASTDGLAVGSYLENDLQLPILLRSQGSLESAWAWSPRLDFNLPLAQLVDGWENVSEETRLKRRDRTLCITVKCNPQNDGQTAAEAFDRVRPRLEAALGSLPAGYTYQWGGEYENSKDANETLAPTFAPILVAMVLVVLFLFNSLRKTAVIFMTLPLIIVGVVTGLLVFDKPFGFMALLGFLSLVGMQVKNAIVLMDEIDANLGRGLSPYQSIIEAGVSRVRPVANASLTTVLGMVPLLTDAFYSAMAVTIMIGLTFATVLTVIVIPVNYALVFAVRKNAAV